MRMACRTLVAVLVSLALAAGCGRAPQGGIVSMTVELDVYSGRPNPTWTLSADEAVEITGLLENLPSAAAAGEEGLGYRGFVLRRTAPAGAEPEIVRVNAGVVTRRRGDRTAHFADTRGVEERLLQQARDRGFGAVLDAVRPR
jgi:hypothetical protein